MDIVYRKTGFKREFSRFLMYKTYLNILLQEKLLIDLFVCLNTLMLTLSNPFLNILCKVKINIFPCKIFVTYISF